MRWGLALQAYNMYFVAIETLSKLPFPYSKVSSRTEEIGTSFSD